MVIPSMATLVMSLALLADAAPRPNIIFIMSDDHAAHAISSYGSKINTTPNLDRLAREGARFTNAFCTNSICGPARATILTGKYSHKNGFAQNSHRFDGSQVTVPKLLKEVGYHTAIIGKWHLVSDPTGFDVWDILPGQGRYRDPVMIRHGKKRVVPGYVTDVITDLAIAEIDKRPQDKPFFLMVHHKAPHREWTPDPKVPAAIEEGKVPEPETLRDDYKNRASGAGETEMTIARHLTPTDLKRDPPAGLSADERLKWNYQRYIGDYLRCVASVDANVGRLLDYLDKSGLKDNTLVIYTSDQGFFLGDHGWYDKRWMYEESLRAPLLVRFPREVPAGQTPGAMALNVDLAETFLDYARAKIPEAMQGRSLRPVLAGKTPADWRTTMYYRYYEYPVPHRVPPHFGVRTARHKLIFYPRTSEWELFDLATDPNELRSVHASPANASLITELKAEMKRLQNELGDDGKVAVR